MPSSTPSSDKPPLRQFNPATNPYPAKKSWPPDVSSMDPKHQFRLERRYRRRSQIAYLRPGWTRGVKLVQYTVILGVVAYGVLGIDWDGEGGGPFTAIRKWIGIEGVSTPFDAKIAHQRIENSLGGRRSSDSGLGKG